MSFVLFRSDLTTGSPSGAARVRLACSHRAGETGPRGTASRVGRWMRARSGCSWRQTRLGSAAPSTASWWRMAWPRVGYSFDDSPVFARTQAPVCRLLGQLFWLQIDEARGNIAVHGIAIEPVATQRLRP